MIMLPLMDDKPAKKQGKPQSNKKTAEVKKRLKIALQKNLKRRKIAHNPKN